MKPCINCGNGCDILPVQLGDSFTLTYLRICGAECMFLIAYEYLYEIGKHKDFRNNLYDKQNEEDKEARDKIIDSTTKLFLEDFRKHLETNPEMLSSPTSEGMMKMFADAPKIPYVSSCIMKFTRPSKEERIKWAKVRVENMKEKLQEAMQDLEALENER